MVVYPPGQFFFLNLYTKTMKPRMVENIEVFQPHIVFSDQGLGELAPIRVGVIVLYHSHKF